MTKYCGTYHLWWSRTWNFCTGSLASKYLISLMLSITALLRLRQNPRSSEPMLAAVEGGGGLLSNFAWGVALRFFFVAAALRERVALRGGLSRISSGPRF